MHCATSLACRAVLKRHTAWRERRRFALCCGSAALTGPEQTHEQHRHDIPWAPKPIVGAEGAAHEKILCIAQPADGRSHGRPLVLVLRDEVSVVEETDRLVSHNRRLWAVLLASDGFVSVAPRI
jgi:hypothetical protein